MDIRDYDHFVYGLYPAVIFFALKTGYLYAARVLRPAIMRGEFSWINHAFPIASVLIMVTMAFENAYYSIGRVWPYMYFDLGFRLYWAGSFKLMYVIGLIFAAIGIRKALEGNTHAGRIVTEAIAIWSIGAWAFYLWE